MTTEINLDFAKETTPVIVYAKQGDGDRTIAATLFQNGLPYTPTGSPSATFRIKKPDGSGAASGNASITTGQRYTVATFTIPAAALSMAGIATAEIVLTSGNNDLSTEPFYINIRESARVVT